MTTPACFQEHLTEVVIASECFQQRFTNMHVLIHIHMPVGLKVAGALVQIVASGGSAEFIRLVLFTFWVAQHLTLSCFPLQTISLILLFLIAYLRVSFSRRTLTVVKLRMS